MQGGIRELLAPQSIPWQRLAIAIYVGVNIGLVIWAPERPGPHNRDWQIFLSLRDQPPYDVVTPGPFRYSPVAAWLFSGLTYLGYWPWFALHVAVLWLLRFSPPLIVLTVVSWGWWLDAMMGNAFTFIFVAGLLAVRGSRGWALVYLALLCLMPRPVQMPLAIWLVWKMPDVRLPAAAIIVTHGVLALLSGELGAWVRILASTASDPAGYNLSPTALIGLAWLIVGVPLSIWLTWKGRVGWAGLAITPYVFPIYWLMPLIDLRYWRQVPRRS